ncbi:hypothetical protein LFWB_2600 [Candidatus Phytoplasma luffae]|uniref:CSD domain-containing protein n=1 Tax=Loofah witches'-broom phytoplasma TaxID=35773 RepID=A0A975FJ27_LOWBP|nr:cold shock domain-containing protein [Candidatus Phytoplasma luffae]QTX02830.1 hypothetical protein LFWB_2600 [Candidatus Phytoplasma luffae]
MSNNTKSISAFEGIVKWNAIDKGYGFIKSVKPMGEVLFNQIAEEFSIDETEIEQFINEREKLEDDLFFHCNSIVVGNEEAALSHYQEIKYKVLKENDRVRFFIKLVKGREQACYIKKED